MRRVLFALLPLSALVADLPPIRGLSRTNLLALDQTGKIAQTAEEWQERRKAALAGFQAVAGLLPGQDMRCELDPKQVEETDCGSYVRRLITYTSQPGQKVPAYLCIPKKALA